VSSLFFLNLSFIGHPLRLREWYMHMVQLAKHSTVVMVHVDGIVSHVFHSCNCSCEEFRWLNMTPFNSTHPFQLVRLRTFFDINDLKPHIFRWQKGITLVTTICNIFV
jgi:hypothetical protein